MSLILRENYENLIVVDLDNGISFVHDNKTGKNYFSHKIFHYFQQNYFSFNNILFNDIDIIIPTLFDIMNT